MSEKFAPYQVVDLTPSRRIWLNTLDLPDIKHNIYGLLEIDVTHARQLISAYQARTGETITFTGFLILCLARALDEDKTIQAYLKGRNQFVIFEDVDVGVMVENQVGDKKGLIAIVIRRANHKSLFEIHHEIRAAQTNPAPGNRGMPGWFRTAMLLPWPFSRLFMASLRWILQHNPAMIVAMSGSVGISSVGMFGKGYSGWGIYSTAHTLDLVVGSTSMKPAVVEGRVEPRQILNLTIVFDHYVVDGAPPARFTRRLVELIESCYGLEGLEQPQ